MLFIVAMQHELKADWLFFEKTDPNELYQFFIEDESYDGKDASFSINIKVEKGWYIYSHLEKENGSPFYINLYTTPKFSEQNIIWPKVKLRNIIMPTSFNISIFEDGDIFIKVNLKSSENANEFVVHGKAFFTLCGHTCIPIEESFHLKIPMNIEGSAKSSFDNIMFLLIILSFAFLGGIILNFMPCILPIISLKVYSLLSLSRRNSIETKIKCLIICAGIITTFLVFGIISAILKASGNYVGWGLHFKNHGL